MAPELSRYLDVLIDQVLLDTRFLANVAAMGGLLLAITLSWFCIRRLFTGGVGQLASATGFRWLADAGKFAEQQVLSALGWLVFTCELLTLVAGFSYHVAGGHIFRDLARWYDRLTVEQILQFGTATGLLVGLVIATRFALGMIRRLRPFLEARAAPLVRRHPEQDAIAGWFLLLERYAITSVLLGTLWAGGTILGLGAFVDSTIGFVFRVITIMVVARLLALGCRALARPIVELGDRRLANTHLLHYWERLSRLIPLGQRCFEAAVYISAATLWVQELSFIAIVAVFGHLIVQCIGVFFCSRVLIELVHVLLHEAFGLYRETEERDQRGETLVPLLHSVCKYLIYFGALVMILEILKVPTTPILAGAGIIGLAGGLGAQSLVTDIVAGVLLLFEGQYFVGDFVEIGSAKGIVEALAWRHTQIRDDQGKLHIIPNGQIHQVINYSKGYVKAVVDFSVPAGSDLDAILRAMAEAGHTLKQTRREVLETTVIEGLVDLNLSDMTIRAVTKVRPGTHLLIENEYRRLLKQTLDAHLPREANLKAA